MRRLVVLGLILLLLAACATPAATTGPRAGRVAAVAPCGRQESAPPTYAHVVWIVLENHSYEDLIGEPGSDVAAMSPYLNGLADSCGLATNAWSLTHPSLPNYLAMFSGRTGGLTRSCTPDQCPQQRRTLVDQVRAHGGSWRVLAESMPTDCRGTDSSPYVVRHNPPTYFPSLAAGCRRWDRPMGTTTEGRLVDLVRAGRLPTFLIVAPNQCHNTHDCPIAAGDRWLSEVVPMLVGGPDYRAGRTAVVVTWDEGAGGYGGQQCRTDPDRSCHVVMVVVAPSTVPGTRAATRFDHYSLLETTERMLGIGTRLGHAGDAWTHSMRAAFDL